MVIKDPKGVKKHAVVTFKWYHVNMRMCEHPADGNFQSENKTQTCGHEHLSAVVELESCFRGLTMLSETRSLTSSTSVVMTVFHFMVKCSSNRTRWP